MVYRVLGLDGFRPCGRGLSRCSALPAKRSKSIASVPSPEALESLHVCEACSNHGCDVTPSNPRRTRPRIAVFRRVMSESIKHFSTPLRWRGEVMDYRQNRLYSDWPLSAVTVGCADATAPETAVKIWRACPMVGFCLRVLWRPVLEGEPPFSGRATGGEQATNVGGEVGGCVLQDPLDEVCNGSMKTVTGRSTKRRASGMLEGPAGTQARGICANGARLCVDGEWGPVRDRCCLLSKYVMPWTTTMAVPTRTSSSTIAVRTQTTSVVRVRRRGTCVAQGCMSDDDCATGVAGVKVDPSGYGLERVRR